MASPIVVGIDGGNSKTDVAVADFSGRVLGRARGGGTPSPIGGSDLPSGGADALAGRLAGLVADAVAETGCHQKPAAAVMYLANVDMPDEQQALDQALAPFNVADQVVVGNDTIAVLRAGTDEGWGVAVVLGSGINAIGIGPDGQTERFLGIGPVSGDWGGGRTIAITGVGAVVRAEDGRGDATALTHSLPSYFGFATGHELALAIRRGTVASSRVLELTPLVFAAAGAGDRMAMQIIERQCDEVVAMVQALIRRLGLLRLPTPVILGGGVARGAESLLVGAIKGRLANVAPLAKVQVLRLPPVVGAVAAALDLAGAGLEAVHNARMHDWDAA